MLTPFYTWQDTRVSAHWNYSFIMHHWYWGMYLVFSIMNPLRVHHEVLMASWLATFIVYESVRQHFSSARRNFHHFSNIKIFASLVFFRTFVFFSFFLNCIHHLYLLYNGNFIFTFVFCIGFPWDLYEFFHYIFQNNSRKKLVSFMTF